MTINGDIKLFKNADGEILFKILVENKHIFSIIYKEDTLYSYSTTNRYLTDFYKIEEYEFIFNNNILEIIKKVKNKLQKIVEKNKKIINEFEYEPLKLTLLKLSLEMLIKKEQEIERYGV